MWVLASRWPPSDTDSGKTLRSSMSVPLGSQTPRALACDTTAGDLAEITTPGTLGTIRQISTIYPVRCRYVEIPNDSEIFAMCFEHDPMLRNSEIAPPAPPTRRNRTNPAGHFGTASGPLAATFPPLLGRAQGGRAALQYCDSVTAAHNSPCDGIQTTRPGGGILPIGLCSATRPWRNTTTWAVMPPNPIDLYALWPWMSPNLIN